MAEDLMDFDRAFQLVVGHEGGYVNDSRDPGGETRYGISKRAYPTVDIKNLTLETAKAIYLRDYWHRCQCDALPWPVSYLVFDMAVNQGVSVAVRVLQTALGVTSDGIIGPMTLAAARTADPARTTLRLGAARLKAYARLDGFTHFGRGWVNRTADTLTTAAETI